MEDSTSARDLAVGGCGSGLLGLNASRLTVSHSGQSFLKPNKNQEVNEVTLIFGGRWIHAEEIWQMKAKNLCQKRWIAVKKCDTYKIKIL